MTLRHVEGFDATIDDARLARFYESYSGSQLLSADNGMHFGTGAEGFDTVLRTLPLVSPNQNTWVVGFAFRPDNTTEVDSGGPAYPYVALRNDDGEQVRLEFFTDNPSSTKPGGTYYKLRVMRGATELAATDQHFEIATGADQNTGWIYFEWKVTVDNSSGTFELKYHKRSGHPGEQTATWDSATSSLDTQDQTSTGVNRLELSWETGNISRPVAFDDIYVLDSVGSVNNDYLGRVAVVVQKPADPAAGDTNDWSLTGGAADLNDAWDELQSGGSDDKRVTSNTTNDVTLSQVDAVPFLLTTTIHGVVQQLSCKMETSGSLTLHHRWRKTTATAAETDGSSFSVSSTTWTGDSDLRELDPNTAAAFVRADLDSYQHGLRNGG